jgi:DNA-directed RNA polymerase specialized sigma24 family protein
MTSASGEPLNEDDLRYAEQLFQRTQRRYENMRSERNAVIRQALVEGWTHQQIADATGLSRGRISQIREQPTPVNAR